MTEPGGGVNRPKRSGWLIALVVGLAMAGLCGVGTIVSLVLADSAPGPAVSAVSGPVGAVGSSAPTLKNVDVQMGVRIIKKDCFGGAGCLVEYQITAKPDGELPSGYRYDITYEVKGFTDGPQIGTLTLNSDGRVEQATYQAGTTKSNGAKLTVRATEVYTIAG